MMHAEYYLPASPPPATFTFLIGVVGADVRVKVMLRVSHAYIIISSFVKKIVQFKGATQLYYLHECGSC
jgi:ascorbate-specific PTS system EIIC-type component UlaA